MTTPRSIIHLAQSILNGMAPRLDGALARIDELADVQDGYPTSVIGAGPATGGNPPRHTCDTHPDDCAACDPVSLTQTERAALAQSHATQERERLHSHLSAAVRSLAAADRIVTRLNPPAKPALCTTGTGRDGHIEWGDPLCTKIAAVDRGGMCDACAKREYRWRRDNGYGARSEVAA